MDYHVKEFGALGTGDMLDTLSIQRAIDACAEGGGGRVVFASGGVYLTGTLHLKSHVELYLERGSRILLSGTPSDFEETRFPGPQRFGIMADTLTDVGICGPGVIDGNCEAYISEKLPHMYRIKKGRPFMIGFFGCRNVSIKDVKITNAPCWTTVISECDNVNVSDISVLNDVRMPHNDGIDIDHSRFVRITNSHFECGDDCIVLKAHTAYGGTGPCEHIAVTNCTMTSRSFAINLGCEVISPIRNCVFDNCVITDSHRGIGVHLSNESDIENVIFSNMYIETRYYHDDWWGAAEPIYVVSIPWTKEDTVGKARNVRFQNIICKSENGVIVYGDKTALVDRITFDGVEVHLNKWTEEKGGRFDLRPCDGAENGKDNGIFTHDTSGFYIQNAKNVALRNCEVVWGENRPDYFGYALDAEDAENLEVTNFKGEHAHGGGRGGISIK